MMIIKTNFLILFIHRKEIRDYEQKWLRSIKILTEDEMINFIVNDTINI